MLAQRGRPFGDLREGGRDDPAAQLGLAEDIGDPRPGEQVTGVEIGGEARLRTAEEPLWEVRQPPKNAADCRGHSETAKATDSEASAAVAPYANSASEARRKPESTDERQAQS
ncbi:hypothetical protein D3248_03315 [Leucobacter zeae]|nr:hypothetical protein [Leucobacter zeae]